MRRIFLIVAALLCATTAYAQDFTNRSPAASKPTATIIGRTRALTSLLRR